MPRQYIVEKIAGKRKINGLVEYLIKWQNYPAKQNTWEPVENLSGIQDLISNYEKESESYQNNNKKSKIEKKVQQKFQGSPKYEGEYVEDMKQIKDIRQRKKILEFFVEGCENNGWISVIDLKEHEPKLLCEFLLKHIQIKK